MKLEDQVCSLEQAKKLAELGINVQSFFIWDDIPFDQSNAVLRVRVDSTHDYTGNPFAYTVAELGIMLPSETLTIRRGSEDSEYANWEWENEGQQKGWGCFDTEAQARADHLIMLLENKLVTPESVNERLKTD